MKPIEGCPIRKIRSRSLFHPELRPQTLMAAAESGAASPPPIPTSSEQTAWADVTSLLNNACIDLQRGELIHGEHFSLFAAMSALEITDPKMDSGMESCGYQSIDEAIEDGAAPVPLSADRTRDIHCTIDIMDHLLSCEATWHKGHSLAQTVFSCLYLLQLERTSPHSLLYSYLRIIRATCNAVISVVSGARTNEEEDIFIMSHGLPLKGEGDEKCLTLMNAVEETISRKLRACKALSSKRKVLEDVEPLQMNPDVEEGYCKAVLYRLRFRKHFYHALMCLRKPEGKGFELAKKHITSCLSELSGMEKSSEFLHCNADGQLKCDSKEESTTASGCKPIGFDANVNRRFSAPTPPREIKLLSWKKTLRYFEKLLHDFDLLCSFSLDPQLEGVLSLVTRFQKTQPDLVARAHLQILLVEGGKLYGRDCFSDVIFRAIGLPDVMRSREVLQNEYVSQLGKLVVNLLKVLCANTAWQRRKLGKILQDWSTTAIQLQVSSRREFGEMAVGPADENISTITNLLLIWTEEQTYWIAARFLMLGFELDLYSPREYGMVYWYLYIVLMKLLDKTRLRLATNVNTLKRKGKKKKEFIGDMAQLSPTFLFLQCYICLSEGLAMMLAALGNRKFLQNPNIFNTEEERFNQHFELLQKAHAPDYVSYSVFEQSTSRSDFNILVRYNNFSDVLRICKELRNSLSADSDQDKLAELLKIEQVAEHNRIAMNVIHLAGTHDPSLNISFELTHHPWFAVAVVRRS